MLRRCGLRRSGNCPCRNDAGLWIVFVCMYVRVVSRMMYSLSLSLPLFKRDGEGRERGGVLQKQSVWRLQSKWSRYPSCRSSQSIMNDDHQGSCLALLVMHLEKHRGLSSQSHSLG